MANKHVSVPPTAALSDRCSNRDKINTVEIRTDRLLQSVARDTTVILKTCDSAQNADHYYSCKELIEDIGELK